MPKSHVYRIVRSGEIRVNGKRAQPTTRLGEGDELRVPPIRLAEPAEKPSFPRLAPMPEIIFEDETLLALNKPAGLAVHGGSGISSGAIEVCRAARPELKFLELVHRLDRDTSGVLLLAKKRAALLGMHALLRDGGTDKRYQVLVKGQWKNDKQSVKLALKKYVTGEGERRVSVEKTARNPIRSSAKPKYGQIIHCSRRNSKPAAPIKFACIWLIWVFRFWAMKNTAILH